MLSLRISQNRRKCKHILHQKGESMKLVSVLPTCERLFSIELAPEAPDSMNIFFLSLNPSTCAQLYCDQHVIKILLEIVQMLYTAHDPLMILECAPFNKQGTRRGYRQAHKNHPMCRWVRSSRRAYTITCNIGIALALEYNRRFGKIHACSEHVQWLSLREPVAYEPFSSSDSTLGVPECMPDEHKDPDLVKAYRSYYTTKTFGRFTRPLS